MADSDSESVGLSSDEPFKSPHAVDRFKADIGGLQYERVTAESEAGVELLEAFQELYDAVAWARFAVVGLDGDAARRLRTYRGSGWSGVFDPFADQLLTSAVARDQLPSALTAGLAATPGSAYHFQTIEPLMLDGSLAVALRDGGPHRQMASDLAYDTAQRFTRTSLTGKFGDLLVLEAHSWSRWFHWESGWSHCWIITDFADSRAYFLAATADD